MGTWLWSVLAKIGAFISDPERFLIDHWPSVLALAFVCSLPWMWSTYLLALRARAVQILCALAIGIALTWSLRGRWDSDQFQKERDAWTLTLHKIDEQNQQAVIEAQQQVEITAKENRETLAKAIAEASAKAGEEKGRADALQRAIDNMPDQEPVILPSKDCPKPPPARGVDPVLRQILRGK